MSLIGYLSPDGKIYSCQSFGHEAKADELVYEFGYKCRDRIYYSEDILLKNGWICIRESDVFKLTRDYDGNVIPITPKQQNFLMQHKVDFNQRQLADLEQMIKDFGEIVKYLNNEIRKENHE